MKFSLVKCLYGCIVFPIIYFKQLNEIASFVSAIYFYIFWRRPALNACFICYYFKHYNRFFLTFKELQIRPIKMANSNREPIEAGRERGSSSRGVLYNMVHPLWLTNNT
jgi:hypothetical protein